MSRLHQFIVFAAILAGFFPAVYGEVNKLTDTSSFSSASILIDFENHADGAEAENLFARWGIVFLGSGETVPVIRFAPSGIPVPGVPANVLRNEATAGSSANDLLIVNFTFPVKRGGFRLGNGDQSIKATIKASDALGNVLGTVEQEGLAEDPFAGVEATPPSGISKLTINYGSVGNAEQIDNFMIEYQSRPTFSTYLPQIADGPLPAGLPADAFQTTIVVSNLTNSTATVEVRLFDSNGQSLSFEFNGSPASSFDLSIPAFSSKSFTSDGNTMPAQGGYACIESNVPVEGTAIFRALDTQGKVVHEAGVGASSGRVTVVGVVQKFSLGNFDSGVAVVNISSENAQVTIHLYDESGGLIASRELKGQEPFRPGEHLARFLNQLFSGLPGDFIGSLLVTSDQPIVVVILRTVRGLAVSSLPVGSTQQ